MMKTTLRVLLHVFMAIVAFAGIYLAFDYYQFSGNSLSLLVALVIAVSWGWYFFQFVIPSNKPP